MFFNTILSYPRCEGSGNITDGFMSYGVGTDQLVLTNMVKIDHKIRMTVLRSWLAAAIDTGYIYQECYRVWTTPRVYSVAGCLVR